MNKLPDRGWHAICTKAERLNIYRSKEASWSKEVRLSISKSLTKYYKDHPEQCKNLSDKTKKLYSDGLLKSPLGKMGNGQQATLHEEIAWLFLEPLGFEKEVSVSTGKTRGTYKLDFGHIEHKIGIEIDGRQHRETRHKERDTKRDKYLSSLGWRIIRIENRQINNVVKKLTENASFMTNKY